MYKNFPKFVLRTPLNTLQQLNNIVCSDDEIVERLSSPIVQEAIFWASPDLANELSHLQSNKEYKNEQKRKIISSFLKYFIRMSSRCTPFGLFAGCTLGTIGNETHVELSTDIDYSIRLDMSVLYAISEKVNLCENLVANLKYRLNSSIYRLGKSYRYIENYLTEDGFLKYRISSIQQTEYIDKIMIKANNFISYNELYTCLICDDVDKENAKAYVNELIKNNILVSELHPKICGNNYFTSVVEFLSVNKENKNTFKTKLIEDILFIDYCLKSKSHNYKNIFDKITLKLDNMGITYNNSQVFQVDMNKKAKTASIGNDVLRELESALVFLNKITPKASDNNLDYFCKVFYERYEEKEISLLLALDTEIGIGYPVGSTPSDMNPLIDQLILPKLPHKQPYGQMSEIECVLQRKMIESELNKSDEIVLDDDDIKNQKIEWDDLPHTFYVLCQIFSRDKEKIIRINSVSGSSASNLISRFSYCNPEINTFVNEIIAKEVEFENEFIFAEIVHLPSIRVGNIITRPNSRKYEIICLANSDLLDEFQIPLSDLFVSVKYGKLFLRSKKLNKYILPRLSTAHNYLNDFIPVYRFLCDYQYYHTKRNSLYLDWGALGKSVDYKPRVRYQNIILSVATWKITCSEIKNIILNVDRSELTIRISDWRKKKYIPKYTVVNNNDIKLLIDWENENSIMLFFDTIKNKQTVIIEEFLFDDIQNSIVYSSKGNYSNEFIFMFYRE